MAITNLAVAEEALALAPAERADLAKLLVQSLEGDPRTDEAITADLTPRLEDLVSGKDSGLNFEQVFGSDQSLASTPRFCKEICVSGFSFWFLFSVLVISCSSQQPAKTSRGAGFVLHSTRPPAVELLRLSGFMGGGSIWLRHPVPKFNRKAVKRSGPVVNRQGPLFSDPLQGHVIELKQ